MPLSSIILVSGSQVLHIPSDFHEEIGLKAYGLSFIPSAWTKPFFVISGKKIPTQRAIDIALSEIRINKEDIFVRSSGVDESIDDRGRFSSQSCKRFNIFETLQFLTDELPEEFITKVHWVVQESIPTKIKGHLSNERRVSEAARDWIVEYESSGLYSAELHNISLRSWRDSTKSNLDKLTCSFKETITQTLKNVCKWTEEQKKRVHYEWVWDGNEIFIVQADDAGAIKDGDNPYELVDIIHNQQCSNNCSEQLKVFRAVSNNNYSDYRKLKNVNIYHQIGYSGYRFYILDSQDIFKKLFSNNISSCKDLFDDLKILTARPLVLRTDGANIPEKKHQMLPRSDELRSLSEAREWLEEKFIKDILNSNLENNSLCLIAHHFIPAVSSAWAQASPNDRMVRIESLWGLPDGVNWYPHDVFDVDTAEAQISNTIIPSNKVLIQKKHRRYKDSFIAPDPNGNWKVHKTDDQHCWASSIHSTSIKEIAWNSRRIAQKYGAKIIIMWFIGIPSRASSHSTLPWYHERDISDELQSPIGAPRRNILIHEKYTIRTMKDWERIKNECEKNTIKYIRVKPKEPDLVRNQKFAHDIAEYSKRYNFIVLLSGGLLSHVYYILNNLGAKVECEDLYTSVSEELEFNKLVRDKIPDKIESHGEHVSVFKVKGEALLQLIKNKIIEEAFEINTAKTVDGISEEIADILEILDALKNQIGAIKYNTINKVEYQIIGAYLSSVELLNRTEVKLTFPIYQNNINISKIISFKTERNPKKLFYIKIEILPKGPSFNLNFHVKEVADTESLDNKSEVQNQEKPSVFGLIETLKKNILIASYEIFDSTSNDLVKKTDELFFHVNKLAETLKIDFSHILSIKNKKANKAGRFSDGLMLVKTRLLPSLTYKNSGKNLALFDDDRNNAISNQKYLPCTQPIFYPDRRIQNNLSELFQYRFEFSTYNLKILENLMQNMTSQDINLSFNIYRTSSIIEVNVLFERKLSTKQLNLFS